MTVSCDYETPTFSSWKTVKAGKDHACEECRGKISKGERHNYFVTLFDGSFSTWRTCPDCEVVICELSRLLSEGSGCDGWLSGGMSEQLDELDDGPEQRRIVAVYNAGTAHRGGHRATRFDNEAAS